MNGEGQTLVTIHCATRPFRRPLMMFLVPETDGLFATREAEDGWKITHTPTGWAFPRRYASRAEAEEAATMTYEAIKNNPQARSREAEDFEAAVPPVIRARLRTVV